MKRLARGTSVRALWQEDHAVQSWGGGNPSCVMLASSESCILQGARTESTNAGSLLRPAQPLCIQHARGKDSDSFPVSHVARHASHTSASTSGAALLTAPVMSRSPACGLACHADDQRQLQHRLLSTHSRQAACALHVPCLRAGRSGARSVASLGARCRGHLTESPVGGRAAQEAGASGPSLNPAEVAKFQELARDWWDPQGSSAALHALNPVRTRFTRDALCRCFR